MILSRKNSAISSSPTLAIDAKFKAMKEQGKDVISFGVGEPDFDTPQNVKQAGIDAINQGWTKYTPTRGFLKLQYVIAAQLMRDDRMVYDEGNIVVSNGTKHSLTNAFMAILNPGDEVIIPAPYWVSYPEIVKIADGTPVIVQTSEANDFKITAAEFENSITANTKAIIINSPCNPTGAVYTLEELESLANVAKKHKIFAISDEVYGQFIYNDVKHATIAKFIPYETIIVSGVSKSHAMTGWRIGYTASTAEIAQIIENIQSHTTSNASSISQAAAIEAFRRSSLGSVEQMRTEFNRRRLYLVDAINKISGISCKAPDGAFYLWVNVKGLLGNTYYGSTIANSYELCESLLENAGIALVPGECFGVPGYVRWSYAASMENIEKGVERLTTFVTHGEKTFVAHI